MKDDEAGLGNSIAVMEEQCRTAEAELAQVDAFKKRVSKNLEALKARFGEEFNGIKTDADMAPLHELAESMTRRIGELTEENLGAEKGTGASEGMGWPRVPARLPQDRPGSRAHDRASRI